MALNNSVESEATRINAQCVSILHPWHTQLYWFMWQGTSFLARQYDSLFDNSCSYKNHNVSPNLPVDSLVQVLLFEIRWSKQTTSSISTLMCMVHTVSCPIILSSTCMIFCHSPLPFWFIPSGQLSMKMDARVFMGSAGGGEKWKRRDVGRVRIAISDCFCNGQIDKAAGEGNRN